MMTSLTEYQPQDFDLLQFTRWRGWLNHWAVYLAGWRYEAFPPKVRRMQPSEHSQLWLIRGSTMTVWRCELITEPQRLAIGREIIRQWEEEVPYNWLRNLRLKDPDTTHCIEYLADALEKGWPNVWEMDHARVGPRRFKAGLDEIGYQLHWSTSRRPIGPRPKPLPRRPPNFFVQCTCDASVGERHEKWCRLAEWARSHKPR